MLRGERGEYHDAGLLGVAPIGSDNNRRVGSSNSDAVKLE
jgi:hypothetical protein